MSVDEELRRAVAESEVVVQALATTTKAKTKTTRRTKLLIRLAGGLVLGGIAVFFYASTQPLGPPPRLSVAQLLRARSEHAGRKVVVSGALAHGTLSIDATANKTRFTMIDTDARDASLAVRYASYVLPDTLRDRPGYDSEVSAVGVLHADGHFDASELLAKGRGPYEMKQRAPSGGLPARTASPLNTLVERP